MDDRVAGPDAGADGYLVKPFAFAELLARLKAPLRRNPPARETVLKRALGRNLVERWFARDGEDLDLTTHEFELLEYRLRHMNGTATRDMNIRCVLKVSHTCGWVDRVKPKAKVTLSRSINLAGVDRQPSRVAETQRKSHNAFPTTVALAEERQPRSSMHPLRDEDDDPQCRNV